MHDHLRDLARERADNETNHPRRLWRPEDLIGISEIKGFQNILMRSEGNCFRCYSPINDKNDQMRCFLESSRTSTDLRWLEVKGRIPEWIPLHNLHSLKLEGESPSRLWQRNNQVSLKLKELYCFFRLRLTDSTHLNKLVSSFGMLKNLERLQLNFENGIFKWNIEWNCLLKSVRELTNLKTLELMLLSTRRGICFKHSGEATVDRFCLGSLETIILCGAFKTRRVSIILEDVNFLKFSNFFIMQKKQFFYPPRIHSFKSQFFYPPRMHNFKSQFFYPPRVHSFYHKTSR
ncbi:uncharacterized protein LOC131051193 [Cryptomeria japonica]|uniref:uncharacterized protein LOC131051193 n=1 Tax=Cryptomeria japonica TaxID=3369 RepID=UPI0025ABE0DF|nr:uncharacterized protein LOC131051193 [Cryptomeria japonica]XP_059066782.1 uncharacterized protein LOC131051193 [Cryptomeria japonica]XP_059066783.1 uncharacterized protein LOC131051193 [Cryptomeria japonica]